MLERQRAAQINQQEIQGEYGAREKQTQKTQALLGMAGSRLSAANQARQQATQSILGGVGQILGGASGTLGVQKSLMGEGTEQGDFFATV
jgi:hypothetical protein